MNQYIRRLSELERKRSDRLKTPVVIAVRIASGEYEYNGMVYSKDEFDELMKKVKPSTIIVDDIPKEKREG